MRVRRWLDARAQNHAYHERAHRAEFFRRAWVALKFNGISGDYVEFGSHGGNTFGLSYQASRAVGLSPHLWSFDSFCGLPPQSLPADEHPAWIEGALATSLDTFDAICAANGIPRSAYTTVPGFYEDTIGGAKGEDPRFPRDVALAYIDCDLHSSTRTVLEFLAPRMKHGMVLALDDYFCWSATALAGERVAVDEWFGGQSRFRLAPYVQYGWHGMAFVVEDVSLFDGLPSGRASVWAGMERPTT